MSDVAAGRQDEVGRDLAVRLKDGGVRMVRSCARFVRHPDGRLRSMIGVNWDVTAQHERAESLLRAKAAADDASHAKGEFLAVMSHELRTPLNGFFGMLELVLATELTDEQRDLLRTMQSSAETLLAVIGDVLDFSKIEAGRVEVVPYAHDVRAEVAAVVDPYRAQARRRGVDVAVEIAADVPARVHADWRLVRQIVANLVDNAFKFTPVGRVVVHVSVAGDRIAPALEEGSSIALAYVVADTGIGMSDSARRRIFTPFEQADAHTQRRFGGTGLGLAIGGRLAERLGGKLTVESEAGRGSTFRLEIPVLVGASARSAVDEDISFVDVDVAPLRVLVAEDHLVNQKVVTAMLERRGHHVRVVGDGARAVAVCTAEAFDVVLMDIEMPELSGIEATLRIREAEANAAGERRSFIIALTAHALAGDRERFLAAGFDAYLTKPLRSEQLLATLARSRLTRRDG